MRLSLQRQAWIFLGVVQVSALHSQCILHTQTQLADSLILQLLSALLTSLSDRQLTNKLVARKVLCSDLYCKHARAVS